MHNVKVVIPARYASTRLPTKPMVTLLGTPMIVHVANRVSSALPDVEVIVATDHQHVVDVVEAAGFSAMLTDINHASGTDRINQVVIQKQWSQDTIVINVQGDEPLIEPELLQQFMHFCLQQQVFSMASVMAEVACLDELMSPHVVKLVIDEQQQALYFSRAVIPFIRDQQPAQWSLAGFKRHVGIYAYNAKVLNKLSRRQPSVLEKCEKLEQLRALDMGIPINMMLWQGDLHGGVDTPKDVSRVEKVLQQ